MFTLHESAFHLLLPPSSAAQDAGLDALAAVISRQKMMGQEIGNELDEQNGKVYSVCTVCLNKARWISRGIVRAIIAGRPAQKMRGLAKLARLWGSSSHSRRVDTETLGLRLFFKPSVSDVMDSSPSSRCQTSRRLCCLCFFFYVQMFL